MKNETHIAMTLK